MRRPSACRLRHLPAAGCPTSFARAARLTRDALEGKPSTVTLHAYEVDDPEDPDAALAIEVSGPPALTPETRAVRAQLTAGRKESRADQARPAHPVKDHH
jgi:hypothetical protein